MKHNTLWVGMKGVFTQAHYDEAHNFFCQVTGRKKFLLFPPSQFASLYVYPYHHPADRQSQVCTFPASSQYTHSLLPQKVDLENPDYEKFPKYKDAKPVIADLGPGDVLYLPPYWYVVL